MCIQEHHGHVFIGHGHAAGVPLCHTLVHGPLPLNVGVEHDGMVGGVGQRKGARAVAVVDVGAVGADDVSLQGYGETPQATLVTSGWAVGTGSGGPQASLRLICSGHRLQGLQQQECTVLAGSCSMQEWKEDVSLQVVT